MVVEMVLGYILTPKLQATSENKGLATKVCRKYTSSHNHGSQKWVYLQ